MRQQFEKKNLFAGCQTPRNRELIINHYSLIMAAIEDENKKAAACCNKRAADGEQGPKWLDSALLLDLEKKLLDVFNGQAGFCRGEDDGDIIDAGLVLANCDFSLFCDVEFRPVAGVDGEGCGVHAYRIQGRVRGGKLISYEVRGRGEYEVFVKILPQDGVVRNG